MRTFLLSTLVMFVVAACGLPDEEDTGSVDSSCATHDECDSGLLCVASSCQAAFPRTFVIGVKSASITATREGGDAWDVDSSAPDAAVEMSLGDGKCRTSVVQDNYAPEWSEACEFEIFESSHLSVTLEDSDLTVNDTIGSWSLSASDIEKSLKGTAIELANGQATLTLSAGLK